jgi:hypothetical protein
MHGKKKKIILKIQKKKNKQSNPKNRSNILKVLLPTKMQVSRLKCYTEKYIKKKNKLRRNNVARKNN